MGEGGVVGPGRARGLSPRLTVRRARPHGRQNPPEAPTGPFGAAVTVRRGGVRKATPYQLLEEEIKGDFEIEAFPTHP